MLQELNDTYAYFISKGFKDDLGGYLGCQFIVRISSARVRSFLLEWWKLVQLFTFRDQVSLTYAAWLYDLNLKGMKSNYLANMLITGDPHRVDDMPKDKRDRRSWAVREAGRLRRREVVLAERAANKRRKR